MLPRPDNAEQAVVVLRLRGRTRYGATLVDVIASYAGKLADVGGRLYLSGISEEAYEQLIDSGHVRLTGPVRAYEATRIVGESTREAYLDAQAWLVRQKQDES
jgi:SulP family sulfate permease